jgi:putative Holliday junction resolvase
LRLAGDPGKMAFEAEQFARRLRKELHTDVELVDERLTTWEAEQTMTEMKSRRRRTRTGVDDVAAAIMLRDYLGRRPSNHGAAARGRD